MEEIKYGDYICLYRDAVSEELQVSFLDYFKFLLDTDFEDLEKQLQERLEIKKFQQRSNAVCLLKTIKEIFTEDLYHILSKEGTPQITLRNYE